MKKSSAFVSTVSFPYPTRLSIGLGLVFGLGIGAPRLLAAQSPVASGTAQRLEAKQLGAPASDILDGVVRLPDPLRSGVVSRTALLALELVPRAQGRYGASLQLPVPGGEQASFALIGGDPSLQAAVGLPLSESSPLAELERRGILQRVPSPASTDLFGQGSSVHFERFEAFAPALGNWRFDFESERSGTVAVVLRDHEPVGLYSHLTTHYLLTESALGVAAYLCEAADGAAAESGLPRPSATATLLSAELYVEGPSGFSQSIPMLDDGLRNDGKAQDGHYGGQFCVHTPGTYTARVLVRGRSADGRDFVRTSWHVFPVLAPQVEILQRVRVQPVDERRLAIEVEARVASELQRVHVSAEVWGHDERGHSVPACWIGNLANPVRRANETSLPLSLDTRWLSLAGVRPPLELRRFRVQDVDTHVPYASRYRIPLEVGPLALEPVESADDEMLMGLMGAHVVTGPALAQSALPRLEREVLETGDPALMLVHGYCSGGNPFPPGHFSGPLVVFDDPNQNRSHDQFALLMRDAGANQTSFGVVAHSQGGAAALHLLTHYWSGLDQARGERRIQSVGSPYLGTPLASNLAILGDIFGSGCGENFDLGATGAALWLSTIPTQMRQEVHYYTTSYSGSWCNFFTDFFLTDPEDGVVEMTAGQLSGAVNMGHTVGWCHTSGMSDPPQTSDAVRNADMNVNACR